MISKRSIKTESLTEFATTVVKKGILVGTVEHGRAAIIKKSRKQKKPLTETEMSGYYVHRRVTVKQKN